ncbi:hypothetical protein VTI28DRAFT_3238 [Corynascus sepedonium]
MPSTEYIVHQTSERQKNKLTRPVCRACLNGAGRRSIFERAGTWLGLQGSGAPQNSTAAIADGAGGAFQPLNCRQAVDGIIGTTSASRRFARSSLHRRLTPPPSIFTYHPKVPKPFILMPWLY